MLRSGIAGSRGELRGYGTRLKYFSHSGTRLPANEPSMKLHEILAAALEAVELANIPEDLRETAFAKAVDIAAVMQGVTPQAAPKPPAHDGGGGGGGGGGEMPAGNLGRLAAALDLDRNGIEQIYMEDGDELQLVVDPDALGKNTKERAGRAALLLAAGRQLGGYDEAATADAVIRKEVDRIHLFEPKHYASTHMKALSPWLNINGSGKTATYRLKPAGRTEVKKVAKQLVNE